MSRLPDPGASCAVLIGTSKYDSLEALPAVANNLSSLARALTGPTSWNLEKERCAVVAEPSTASQILDVVQAAVSKATDTLLVYYAGHGLQTHRGELYLAVSGSVPGREDTGLAYRNLREMILDGRAKRHVVLLDCCFSGKALGAMSDTSSLADRAEIEGSYVLAAAPENRMALAPPGEAHTAFTGEVLEVLNSGIPGNAPLLDLDAVYQHVRRALIAKGRPVPQKRDRNTAGQLALGRNSAYRATPLPYLQKVGVATGGRPWPDPSDIQTVKGFIDALSDVRIVSGMTQKDISRYSGGRISVATVSKLLNRTTLPHSWKTTSVYLSACGMPADQIAVWEKLWERLRADLNLTAVRKSQKTEPEAPSITRVGIWKKLGQRGARGNNR